jgi:signal transduction histidine kinase
MNQAINWGARTPRIYQLLLVAVFSMFCMTNANANGVDSFHVDDGITSSNSLDGHIYFLEDPDGSLSIDEISQVSEFSHAGKATPNFKFTESVYWFRFEIVNHFEDSALILELGYPLLDQVSLFAPRKGGGYVESKSGDMLPFSERAKNFRTITFNLDSEQGRVTEYFLRIKTSSSMQLPLKIYTENSFHELTSQEDSFLAAYYGVILVMILFNCLLGISLKDKVYFVYILFLGSFLIFQMVLNGNGHRWIFMNHPTISNTMLPVSFFVSFGFGFRFSRSFLDLSRSTPAMNWFLLWGERSCWVLTLLALVVPYSIMAILVILYGLGSPVFWVVGGIVAYRAGFQPAKSYLIAWAALLLGGMIFALKTADILPVNVFTNYAMQFGSALEVVLLSLALANRIHMVQGEKLDAQNQLVAESAARGEVEKRLNQSLNSRLFLFGDLAHRLNNPLNVAHGGLEVAQRLSQSFLTKVLSFFPEPSVRSQDEQIVVGSLEEMAKKIEAGFQDADIELKKAAGYVSDLRVIGGVNGSDAKKSSLAVVLKQSLVRVEADIGFRSVKLRVEGSPESMEVVGPAVLLSMGLSAFIQHGFIRTVPGDDIVLSGIVSKEPGFVVLEIRRDSGKCFEKDFREDISAKDIVLGLLGGEGAHWEDESNEMNDIEAIRLHLAATESAWLKAQDAEYRK